MKYALLDCTLRDGGYITNWRFSDEVIRSITQGLSSANLDYVEVGYLNSQDNYQGNTTQFDTAKRADDVCKPNTDRTIYLAMADVQKFSDMDIEPYDNGYISGIRVVFYKHQIEEGIKLSRRVKECGYKLFVQPMVTIDYSTDEYARLLDEIARIEPYAVSIVDSFGYMMKEDFRNYFRILDNSLDNDARIGFHSHNNLDLAFVTAQDVLDYNTQRNLIIDCSLYGMGRGAGNLNTELIARYYNQLLGEKYDIDLIISLISKYIMPIFHTKKWGYSPYLFLTGMKHYHPNYACYLLDEIPDVSVDDFSAFLDFIPDELKTKCRKPYVMEQWKSFSKDR